MISILIFTLVSQLNANDPHKPNHRMNIIMMRHGDRTAITNVPDDPKPPIMWNEGPGGLLNTGKSRAYHLGQYFADYYKTMLKLVNDTYYLPSDVYVRSSGEDRCLMTAESLLAGMYPPQEWQIWNKLLSWQPIPIQTVPGNEDHLLRPLSCDCPTIKNLLLIVKNVSMAKIYADPELNRQLKDLEKQLSREFTYDMVWEYHDSLKVKQENNETLPSWASPLVVEYLSNLSFAMFFEAFGSNIYGSRKLMAGPFITHLENLFNQYRRHESLPLYIFVTDDNTIMSVIHAIGLPLKLWPSYADYMILDVTTDAAGNHHVDVSYRHYTGHGYDNDTYCARQECKPYTMDHLLEIMRPYKSINREKECGMGESHSSGSSIVMSWGYWKVTTPWIIVVFILCSILLFSCFNRKPNDGYQSLI